MGGTIPVRFPSQADPGDAGWHIEASYDRDGEWRVNHRSRARGLLALYLLEIRKQRGPIVKTLSTTTMLTRTAADPAATHSAHSATTTLFFPPAFALNRLGQHYDIDPADAAKWGTLMKSQWFWNFAFLNSNFHLEHHYFPGVPAYRLPALRGALQPFFDRRGIAEDVHTEGNGDGLRRTAEILRRLSRGLLFVNLVDFDMLYGHRNDVAGYASNLERIDARISEVLARLGHDDLLVLTADHGNDPTIGHSHHTREVVPVLVYQQGMIATQLGVRTTLSDVGATVCEFFRAPPPQNGRSFLSSLRFAGDTL